MLNDALFSSTKDNWGTPQWLFDLLHERYQFEVDLFASKEDALLPFYIDDAFNVDWQEYARGKTGFGNPPYRAKKPTTWDFVKLAYDWAYKKKDPVPSVLLIPARTDTKVFINNVLHRGRLHFVEGRVKFKGAEQGAPFPSIVVHFDPTLMKVKIDDIISARNQNWK